MDLCDKLTVYAINNYIVDQDAYPGVKACVWPVFNPDTTSVLLMSTAEVGKVSCNVDPAALTPAGMNDSGEWKMTFKSDGRNAFTAATEYVSGGKLTIRYSGALPGTKEYVSGIVVNREGQVTYYGRVQKPAISTIGEKMLGDGKNYMLAIKNIKGSIVSSPKNADNYTFKAAGKGSYTGSTSRTFIIVKASNPLRIKADTAVVKYSKLRQKNRMPAVSKVIRFTKKVKEKG